MTEPEDRIAERYLVLELLGRGGMGAVYRVRDERAGREVALKRLHTTTNADSIALELFEREFHTLSEIAHPRIIEVYDYGVDSEGAYYTMELLGGSDVRALGKVPWQKACELLRDVISSLAILHSRRLLHNDVSPRNVRCTLDGRAKLLDFGAMMPMGVNKRIVGTPPFIAPEMLNQQALDGRTDLYSFGALAYGVMTGRTAYPAQDVRQLRDLWRRPLTPPQLIDPQIPAPLGDLVLELLQLNRNARPRSAAVVMERLCSIAGLPFDEAADVAQAYLTTPTLIGRDEPLGMVREQLLSSMRGNGCAIVVAANGGGGRSRFLDACVLDAKLLGFQVVRVDRADADRGSYGAAAALCRQLFELGPKVAAAAARLHAPILAHVLGSELAGAEPAQVVPERRQLLSSLRDFVLSAARSLRLMLAVDDADRIDEESASMLSTLAQKTRRRSMCMVLTVDSERPASAALEVLNGAAQRIELLPMSEAQTEQLLGAVFGDAKNLVALARRVHAISRGTPRATMQLVTHLVDRGIARYQAGSFILPEQLNEADLPQSLTEALIQRVASLEPDARELAEVLTLTDPAELPPSSYFALTSHGEHARTYRALDALLRAQVLETQGERYRLSDPAWSSAFAPSLSAERRTTLNARLASAFEETGTLTRRAHHLMESQQPQAAIHLLLAQYLKDPNEPSDPLADYVPGLIEQLERAAVAAEQLDLPAPVRMELRMKVCGASQFLGDLPRFLRIAPPTMRQLIRESGLAEYLSLDPSLDRATRLTQALTRTHQLYQATPESKRGLAPADAIRELSRLCAISAGITLSCQDESLWETIPSLEPFVPLSPAIAVIHQQIEANHALSQGRERRAYDLYAKLVTRLEQPDGAGLGQLYSKSLRLSSKYSMGLSDGSMGIADAAKHVAEMEHEPGHRVNAQRVHMVCQLMQGDAEAAAASQRRAELMLLQDGQLQRYPGSTARAELMAYWLSDDLAGLKQLIDRIAGLTERYPASAALLHLARCLYRQIQGDPAGALRELEPALASTKPLDKREWAWVAAAHLQVLVSLNRIDEALRLGFEYCAVCRQHELVGYRRVAHATAEALIANGQAAEAAGLADELIAEARAAGARGLPLGAMYELRAQAALALDDDDAFIEFSEKCAAEYRPERNTALAARYQRLFRAAARKHAPAVSDYPVTTGADAGGSHVSALSSVHSRLLECIDADSRAQCVLAILAEQVNAEQAYLYGMRAGQLSLVCGLPDEQPPQGLQAVVEGFFSEQLALDPNAAAPQPAAPTELGSTEATTLERDVSSVTHVFEAKGSRLYPILLTSRSEGEAVIAGVAALNITNPMLKLPPQALLESLAAALLENDDVDPATCLI